MALAVGFASCDDYKEPNPPAQSNPQESILQPSDIRVIPSINGVYDLTKLNETGTPINIATIECGNLPEGFEFISEIEISANGFEKAYPVTSTVSATGEGVYNVSVTAQDLEDSYAQNITKHPDEATIDLRFRIGTQSGTDVGYVGGSNSYYGPFEITILPYDPAYDQNYYIVPCDAQGNLQLANAIKMDNTAGNVTPYDNPKFVGHVEVTTEAGFFWKIVPGSDVTAGTVTKSFGAKADTASEGWLGADYGAGEIKAIGSYLLEINIESMTYKISTAYEFLYPIYGRTAINDTTMKLVTSDYVNYHGAAVLSNYFTLYADKNKTIMYTQLAGSEQTTAENGTVSGRLYNGNSLQTIPLSNGSTQTLYWFDVDLYNLKYSYVPLNTLSVIGDGNDWNLETAAPLTAASSKKTWSATGVTIGNEFKINANGAWDYSFSGTLLSESGDTSVFEIDESNGGANIPATPGVYDVTVDFSSYPYTLTIVRK